MAANRIADAMLKVGQPPALSPKTPRAETTVEVRKDTASVEFQTPKQDAEEVEGEARDHLKEAGLDPAEWEVTSFRSSEWTMASGEPGRSARFGFARKSAGPTEGSLSASEIIAWVNAHEPPERLLGEHSDPSTGFLFLIGDMQIGKEIDSPVDGVVERCISYIDQAVERYLDQFGSNIREVVVGWLGDHIEGFQSQGGANVWRTQLTLTEQIRVTRRIMAYAVKRFAEAVPHDVELKFVAIPGNHGETTRFAGKGVTRYDDSHDTDALIAVAEACEMSENPNLQRIKFFTPNNDELVVVLDVADTRIGFAHGHQHRPGKAIEWLKGQTFDKENPLRDVDLLVEGHLHHLHMDSEGGVYFLGLPAVEAKSQWYKLTAGANGDPGAVIATVSGGRTQRIEIIR